LTKMMGRKHWMKRGAVFVAVVCCLLTVTTLDAQSKKSAKQADSLEKAGEGAKSAIQDMLEHLGKLLAGYNSIINGEVKNSQSAYKKLVGDMKGADKKIEGAKKQLNALNKEADKFFQAWEKDLASISSDSVREKSANRMEAARARYASIGEALGAAGEELAPVVENLNDQILFLGRDLSPEAVADLQDEAEELNQQAADATAKIKELLQSAGKAQAEADAELEGDEEE